MAQPYFAIKVTQNRENSGDLAQLGQAAIVNVSIQ